jgi:hypothetical protein
MCARFPEAARTAAEEMREEVPLRPSAPVAARTAEEEAREEVPA